METLRPHSYLKKVDLTGYSYMPVGLQRELGIREDKTATVPVFINANVAVMIRKNAKKADVLKGLKILAEDIKLRWKEETANE